MRENACADECATNSEAMGVIDTSTGVPSSLAPQRAAGTGGRLYIQSTSHDTTQTKQTCCPLRCCSQRRVQQPACYRGGRRRRPPSCCARLPAAAPTTPANEPASPAAAPSAQAPSSRLSRAAHVSAKSAGGGEGGGGVEAPSGPAVARSRVAAAGTRRHGPSCRPLHCFTPHIRL